MKKLLTLLALVGIFSCTKELGKPTGVKQIASYRNAPRAGEMFSTFKLKAPSNTKAAVRYNDLLCVDDEDNWRKKTALILVARQNGKTHLARMLILAHLFLWGSKNVLGMSSNRNMALDTFRQVTFTIEDNQQYKCLTKLWGAESAWNDKAVGNLDGKQQVYGIPQGKSEYLSKVDGYKQIDWGLSYLFFK